MPAAGVRRNGCRRDGHRPAAGDRWNRQRRPVRTRRQRRGIRFRLATLDGPAQRSIQVGMRGLEIADDLEIDPLHLREVDLLDMHEPQELAHGLRHFAPAFVPRAAALRDADLRPELFLVESQTTADFARIEDAVENFHAVDGSSGVGWAMSRCRRRFVRSVAAAQAKLYQWHILGRLCSKVQDPLVRRAPPLLVFVADSVPFSVRSDSHRGSHHVNGPLAPPGSPRSCP